MTTIISPLANNFSRMAEDWLCSEDEMLSGQGEEPLKAEGGSTGCFVGLEAGFSPRHGSYPRQ